MFIWKKLCRFVKYQRMLVRYFFFLFSRSFYLSFVCTVWRLMLTAFHRQCNLLICILSRSSMANLISTKKPKKNGKKTNSRNPFMVEKQTRHVHVHFNIYSSLVFHSFTHSQFGYTSEVCVKKFNKRNLHLKHK